MADHADHIHVGFRPLYGVNEDTAKQVDAILKPEQWIKLIDRLDEIDNPRSRAARRSTRSRRASAPARPTRASSTPGYFGFVQWELPGRLGPDPGRYVVRRYAGDEAQQVVVIGGLAAPRRTRRRARPAEDGATPVDVTRATVVAAEPLDGEAAAERGSRRPRRTPRWRATPWPCSTPPCTPSGSPRRTRTLGEVAARHALVTRVGYGTGEEVAEGRWTAARELPPERAGVRREAALRPQERFAALLAGRDVALAGELLALRARLDLDHGRAREAALQLDAALGAALGELEGWRELTGMPERLDELRALAPGVADAAASARAGALEGAATADVAHALARLEAALRARTAHASF